MHRLLVTDYPHNLTVLSVLYFIGLVFAKTYVAYVLARE
nr:MAG TPA: hypothetical protein [Bacteriophage sp.]